MYPVLEKASKT